VLSGEEAEEAEEDSEVGGADAGEVSEV